MFPRYYHGSPWAPVWVALIVSLATSMVATAVAAIPASPYPLTALQTFVLVALLAFASSATVILPEGTYVRPVQAGHIPLALLLGWPFAPVVAVVVRGSTEFRAYARARKLGQSAYLGFAVFDTAVAVIAVTAAGWFAHVCDAPLILVAFAVFAVEDLLALHNLALSGWQESWMEGGVSVRWRYALRLMWLPAAVSYPAVLAAGMLFTSAIARGEWAIIALTGIAAQTLPLLLKQRSLLLAEQAESAMNAVNAMEARDEYTRGHTVRVTTVTIKILRELRFPFSDRIRAALIGPLHDIGKVTTSDRVLQKPGFHEPHERKEMEAHVADDLTTDKHWHWLLARRPELSWLVDLIAPGTRVAFERRLHHLEPSGNGYPAELQQHIRGRRIPIVARAMAVADVWDAMTSTRPYRAGMPAEKALQLLQDPNDRRQTYGGQLDRDCVDALVRLAKRGEVVPNDTSLLEFNRIRERLGERPPASAVSRLYAQALFASAALTWLTATTGTSPWWSLLLTVQVGWALWANSATVRNSYELLRRLAIEAERRTGYDNAQATIRERSDLAAWLGRARGLPRKEVDRIRQAAELMNLGTLIVSDSDWRSSEPLPDTAIEKVRSHPIESARLAPATLHDLIAHHHERWDGTGYPHRLQGNDIPIGAQILHLVEVWTALRSDRPHRRALTPQAALAELRRDVGAFDPELIQLLESAVRRDT